ncbi:MAG TPA: hypothetical protein DCZ94_18625 [Lentisphaeria bacterium]|nr:MAG: hypothetical protein A2X48_24185 [Lentisphaerae bacterium GWF2_49_21]HBC88962.1 hypothetical protein [Lentisphaeria bacterium]
MKAKIIGVVLFAVLISSFAADEEKKPAGEQDLNAIKARADKEAAPYFSAGEKNTALMKAGGGAVSVSPLTLVPVLEGIIIFKGEVFKSANPELVEGDAMIEEVFKKAKAAEEEVNNSIKTIADSKAKIAELEKDMADSQAKMMKETDKEEKGKYNTVIFQSKKDASELKKEMKKLEKDVDKKKLAAADALKKANALKAVLDAYNANQKKLGGGSKKGAADPAPGVKKEGNFDPFAPKQ